MHEVQLQTQAGDWFNPQPFRTQYPSGSDAPHRWQAGMVSRPQTQGIQTRGTSSGTALKDNAEGPKHARFFASVLLSRKLTAWAH